MCKRVIACLAPMLTAISIAIGMGSISIANASSGLESLDYFFNQVNTFEARFRQKVIDESLAEIDEGQGTVWIQRPGLFRWDYEPPQAQEIVGDGDNVWLYDIELEQITVRKQLQTLGKSPAILLAGSGNLEENYDIEDIGTQQGYDWVKLIPKNDDSGFMEIRIGFENKQLRSMELLDNLGQATQIVFVNLKENLPIPRSTFDFIVPQGVDIIDQRTP